MDKKGVEGEKEILYDFIELVLNNNGALKINSNNSIVFIDKIMIILKKNNLKLEELNELTIGQIKKFKFLSNFYLSMEKLKEKNSV